jgi:hypothetical protein
MKSRENTSIPVIISFFIGGNDSKYVFFLSIRSSLTSLLDSANFAHQVISGDLVRPLLSKSNVYLSHSLCDVLNDSNLIIPLHEVKIFFCDLFRQTLNLPLDKPCTKGRSIFYLICFVLLYDTKVIWSKQCWLYKFRLSKL